MNNHPVRTRPQPSAEAAPKPGSWDLMEGRLATAQVDDLLGHASSRLARLLTEARLPDEVATAARDTLRAVESGRESIGSARRCLRT